MVCLKRIRSKSGCNKDKKLKSDLLCIRNNSRYCLGCLFIQKKKKSCLVINYFSLKSHIKIVLTLLLTFIKKEFIFFELTLLELPRNADKHLFLNPGNFSI